MLGRRSGRRFRRFPPLSTRSVGHLWVILGPQAWAMTSASARIIASDDGNLLDCVGCTVASGPCGSRDGSAEPTIGPKQSNPCDRPGLRSFHGRTFEMVPPIARPSCEGGWSDEGIGVAGPLRQRSPTTIAREPGWHLPRSAERRDSCFGSRRSPVQIRAPRLAEGSCKTAVSAVALSPPLRAAGTVLGCTRGAPAFHGAPRGRPK